jgi:protein-S-isoprenylcysteine O-methyltransferase Ste14
MMLLSLRAVTYATLFIGFVLVALPFRLATAFGLSSPGVIGWQQILGVLFALAGGVIALWCVATFVAIGRGTPAPFDPPRRLVDRGPYAVVRNPMYVGAALAMSGAGLFYSSWVFFAYTAAFLGAMHLFILIYEEPTLRNTFGAAYADYCRSVGRWLPV